LTTAQEALLAEQQNHRDASWCRLRWSTNVRLSCSRNMRRERQRKQHRTGQILMKQQTTTHVVI